TENGDRGESVGNDAVTGDERLHPARTGSTSADRDAGAVACWRRHGQEFAAEKMWCRTGHAYLRVGAWSEHPRAGEMDELVLGGSAGRDRWISFGRAFDDDLFDPVDSGLVTGEGGAIENDLEAFESFGDNGWIDEVVHHFRGFGSRS